MLSSSKKILITGGAGFIGSNLCNHIRRMYPSQEMIIADMFLPRGDGNIGNIEEPHHPLTKCVDIDLSMQSLPIETLKECEIIFHLAAQVSHPKSMNAPNLDLRSNQMSTLLLLDALKNIHAIDPQNYKKPNIVFTSTRQLYGEVKYLPVDEEHPVSFKDNNAIHKYASESYLKLYAELGICSVSILRLTNTFGPHMDLHANHKGFVPIFFRQALEKQSIQLWGDGKQKRDFNYVDDVVTAILLCAQQTKTPSICEVYNLGGETSYSLMDFLNHLNAIIPLRYELQPWPKDRKNIDIGDYEGSYKKIEKHLDWSPKHTLNQGLKLTLEWFLKQKR